MPKTSNINKLLKYLTPDQTSADFAEFDNQVSLLKDQLKEKITIKTLEDVQNQLEKFKKKFNLQPLLDSMSKLQASFDVKSQELYDEIETKGLELSNADKERVDSLRMDILDLQVQLSTLEDTRKTDLEEIYTSIPNLSDLEDMVNEMMLEISSRLDTLEEIEKEEMEDWQKKIDELRRELMNRISNIGGGNMNRQIFIGGVNPLTRFTDINLKAGSNVTITYATNNATQKVDVTFSATGGGGGSVRSIQSISASQTADSVSGTDYVYLCNGTFTLTMPDASGNTNLYTIKNIGTGVITINTTSSQTIDGSLTITMPLQYTSVDLVSDTANWNIT